MLRNLRIRMLFLMLASSSSPAFAGVVQEVNGEQLTIQFDPARETFAVGERIYVDEDKRAKAIVQITQVYVGKMTGKVQKGKAAVGMTTRKANKRTPAALGSAARGSPLLPPTPTPAPQSNIVRPALAMRHLFDESKGFTSWIDAIGGALYADHYHNGVFTPRLGVFWSAETGMYDFETDDSINRYKKYAVNYSALALGPKLTFEGWDLVSYTRIEYFNYLIDNIVTQDVFTKNGVDLATNSLWEFQLRYDNYANYGISFGKIQSWRNDWNILKKIGPVHVGLANVAVGNHHEETWIRSELPYKLWGANFNLETDYKLKDHTARVDLYVIWAP